MRAESQNLRGSPRVKVKICGITRPEDARSAANLGADAIGLVFYQGSRRAVTVHEALNIVRVLPPFVSKVGLFVDATANEIEAILSDVPLDVLQFHGEESPEVCRRYSIPYIKAVRMRENVDLASIEEEYADACGLLLDSYKEGVKGGAGESFDWSKVPKHLSKPIILAGGLTPENVGRAIAEVGPYAVDVSGGVESSYGVKDAAKIAAFMRGVSNANS
ncbi:MAG: phosphoribosylanthranilate isomerase [Gammaproteobacteria bacterium]|nr:phosphoribosylanthranilate isomerase [Gammaproteobacteria bacterium]MCI0591562.1 phosphoribosylanthranilate isomerase [Gammaproteobacteria bacterium]